MEKKIVQVQERTQQLIRQLLNVWESSVRATHDFLSEEEIIKIREYVPMAIENVEYLIIAEKEFGEPVAFMGIDSNRLEMLFLSPEVRGKGLGKQLLQYGIETYNIQELTVNEQNPQAVNRIQAGRNIHLAIRYSPLRNYQLHMHTFPPPWPSGTILSDALSALYKYP